MDACCAQGLPCVRAVFRDEVLERRRKSNDRGWEGERRRRVLKLKGWQQGKCPQDFPVSFLEVSTLPIRKSLGVIRNHGHVRCRYGMLKGKRTMRGQIKHKNVILTIDPTQPCARSMFRLLETVSEESLLGHRQDRPQPRRPVDPWAACRPDVHAGKFSAKDQAVLQVSLNGQGSGASRQ